MVWLLHGDGSVLRTPAKIVIAKCTLVSGGAQDVECDVESWENRDPLWQRRPGSVRGCGP